MQLNLSIVNESHATVQTSFDRMAKELILNWNLQINETLYQFIDLEFYYYKEGIQPDRSAHEHSYQKGKWRGHQHGIDISLGFGDDWDGGILIRGIKSGQDTVIGPKKVLWEIFKQFGDINTIEKKFGLVENKQPHTSIIRSGIRHGLGISVQNEYKEKLYRYYAEEKLVL